MTREEKNLYQKEYRQKTKNTSTKKYEKTPKGFLMRTYRNMQSRVTGVQWKKAHLYKGLELLPRQEFYNWSQDNVQFWRLFRQWEANGYARKLTPSINRINTAKGYIPGNIEWLTHSVNSSLGGYSRGKAKTLQRIYENWKQN